MGHKKEKKIHRALKIYGVWALLVGAGKFCGGVVRGLGAVYPHFPICKHLWTLWTFSLFCAGMDAALAWL